MPVMDGYKACKKIRELIPKKNHLNLIALTADATLENKSKCQKIGFDNMINKPFRKKHLKQFLTRLFH